jgi:hypothetical protein
MNVQDRSELAKMGEWIQHLALEIARLSQAVEPLVRMQQEQESLRDRVAHLEGFRAAVLWLSGLSVVSVILRYVVTVWFGGENR